MTHAGYVFAGYAATAAVLATYAWWIVSRTRKLTRHGDQATQTGKTEK